MQDNGYQFAMVNYLSMGNYSPTSSSSISCGQRIFLLKELEYIQNQSRISYCSSLRIPLESVYGTNTETTYNHGTTFCDVNEKTIKSGFTIILFK